MFGHRADNQVLITSTFGTKPVQEMLWNGPEPTLSEAVLQDLCHCWTIVAHFGLGTLLTCAIFDATSVSDLVQPNTPFRISNEKVRSEKWRSNATCNMLRISCHGWHVPSEDAKGFCETSALTFVFVQCLPCVLVTDLARMRLTANHPDCPLWSL